MIAAESNTGHRQVERGRGGRGDLFLGGGGGGGGGMELSVRQLQLPEARQPQTTRARA